MELFFHYLLFLPGGAMLPWFFLVFLVWFFTVSPKTGRRPVRVLFQSQKLAFKTASCAFGVFVAGVYLAPHWFSEVVWEQTSPDDEYRLETLEVLPSLGQKYGVYRLYDHRTGRPVGNSPFVDLKINRDVSWPGPFKPQLDIGKDIVFRMQARH
jgi:hypothetical protein